MANNMSTAITPSVNSSLKLLFNSDVNHSYSYTVQLEDAEYAPNNCSLFNVLYILAHINVYYTPVMIFIGSVLNVITSLTLRYTKLRKNPISHYLAAKCLSDMVFLFSLGFLWVTSAGLPSLQTDATCPYLWLASQMSTFLSIWLMVMMCIERSLQISDKWFVCFGQRCGADVKSSAPRKRPECTVLKSQICVIALVILALVVYVNISHTIGSLTLADTSICAPLPVFHDTYRILNKLDLIINVIIPNFIIISMCGCTWKSAMHLSALRKGTIAHRSLDTQGTVRICPKNELHLTRMVVIYCTIIVLLTCPSQALRIMHDARDSLSANNKLSIMEYLWQHCLQVLFQTSFSMNFFILLIAHRQFRKSLRQLVLNWIYRLKTVCYRHHRQPSQLRTMQAFQFTVEFSSTLVRLKETSLG